MGLLIEGRWHDQWYDTKTSKGAFERQDARFRNWVTADGAPGPSGEGGFEAAAGRYHLFVSLACPWAHRTLIFRGLKGLADLIEVTVVEPLMLEQGWSFAEPGEPLYGKQHLYELYQLADPAYSGRVTVPVLWDKKRRTVVSNESSEIIRMFNSAFDHLTGNDVDFYPQARRTEIDAVNARIYETVNNGVYRAGFATTQGAYEDAFDKLFVTLDWAEDRLAGQRYIAGDELSEADWRFFTTLVRFDAVYHGHFKTNLRRVADYPNLQAYLRALYQVPGVAGTVDFGHIKQHYYASHRAINPTGIVPKGPVIDLEAPHDRDRFATGETWKGAAA